MSPHSVNLPYHALIAEVVYGEKCLSAESARRCTNNARPKNSDNS